MPFEYEQQPRESSPAFRAFAIYRDLGAARSLAAAYASYSGAKPGIAPGHWNAWSGKHRWVERAAAYDAHLDAELRRAREREMLKLEVQRWRFELRNQDALERRVDRMDELLDKAEATPVNDVVIVKDETEESIGLATTKKTRTKTSVKALKMAGYSRTVQVRNETAKWAITGVRDEKKVKRDAEQQEARRVTGLVFRPVSTTDDDD